MSKPTKQILASIAIVIVCGVTLVLCNGCSSCSSGNTTKYHLESMGINVDNAWKSSHPDRTVHFNHADEKEGTQMVFSCVQMIGDYPDAKASDEERIAYEKQEIGIEFPATDTSTVIIDSDTVTCDTFPTVTATMTATGDVPSTTRLACLVYNDKAYFLAYTAAEGEALDSPFDATLATLKRG